MIVVNDEPRPWRDHLTVLDVVRDLDPTLPIAVVRLNGRHLSRADWDATAVRDGDEIRVVWIIAGG